MEDKERKSLHNKESKFAYFLLQDIQDYTVAGSCHLDFCENKGLRNQFQNDGILSIAISMCKKLSFVSDTGVSYLLPTSIKLWEAHL